MKRFILMFSMVVCLYEPFAEARTRKQLNPGMEYLESSFEAYDSLQKKIHSFAEPGYLEYKSSEALAGHLEKHGFKVERGVAGIPTAFVASYGCGKPVIGILAEYDALPGMGQDTLAYPSPLPGAGHGCGHNLLGSAAVAGAVAISKCLDQYKSGTVCVFGCPAEEGGGGKAYMVREGCFENVDIVLDWHPDTQICVNDKTGLANVQVRFTFEGRSAHASGAPENGRSALDAVEAFDYMMNMMREHIPSDSRIHYVITDGGRSANIVPDRAEVQYYLRNPSRTVVGNLLSRAVKAAEGAALGTETSMKYEIVSGNYERLPNDHLSALIYRNLVKVGGIVYDDRELSFAKEMMANSDVADFDQALSGIRNVVTSDNNILSDWVSSDVGNVTWVVPTGSFRMASFVPAGGGHCWQQTSSGGTTIGTKGLMAAAKVFCLTACDLLGQPSLILEIQAEFDSKRPAGFKFEPLMGDRKPPLDYRK